jgi:hypothetical protein
LIELWAWGRSHKQLVQRGRSPWDEAGRRPWDFLRKALKRGS